MTKYGRNLLKPPATRPVQWKAVMFSNNIFRNRVDVVQVSFTASIGSILDHMTPTSTFEGKMTRPTF